MVRSVQFEPSVSFVDDGPVTADVAWKLADLLTDALHEEDHETAMSKLDEARRLLGSKRS